jgi:plastocyanin
MRGRNRRRLAAIGAGVLLAGTGCGGADDGGDSAAPSSGSEELGVVTIAEDGVQEVTLRTQDDFVFTPDRFTVAPGEVRLTLVNAAEEMTHNLEFDDGAGPEPIGAGIDYLAPGQEMTIDFTVAAPGDHPFSCTFHTVQGQVGTMTVRG